MFKDIELKLNYHKERIITNFIKRGIYPDNRLIQSQLNDIELRLSIFKNPKIKEGSQFNTDIINDSIKYIYDDLAILYKLLYEVTVTEYNRLSYYINSHLRELEDTAQMYLKRANLESYSTALGKSILFKHNDFEIDKKDNNTVINLGKISISDATKIACIGNINNVEHNNVVFKFRESGVDNPATVSCNSYSYNRDFVVFPGELEKKEYEISISESQKINSTLELPIVATDPNNGKFITLAGKDKILYKMANENGEIIEEKPIAINALSFKSHSYIDFYIVGGSSVTFRFNKKPLATNFNTNVNRIENLDYIHHFFIECDEDFSFDFELERGSVYAIKENTLINQEKFYYSGQVDVKDFMIVHFLSKEPKEYDATVEIYNTSISEDDIESIMIKKIG
jgi:hypothetical protein